MILCGRVLHLSSNCGDWYGIVCIKLFIFVIFRIALILYRYYLNWGLYSQRCPEGTMFTAPKGKIGRDLTVLPVLPML